MSRTRKLELMNELVEKKFNNTSLLLDGYILNPEYVGKKIIGSMEIPTTSQESSTRCYLLPFAISSDIFLNGDILNRVLNLLTSFYIDKTKLCFKGKYTNDKKGLLSRLFEIEKISVKDQSKSYIQF